MSGSFGPVLITPDFVFVHVPKTGGTWVRGMIPAEWRIAELETHREHDRVPPEYTDLPVLAFVRNPWDWYVSFWDDRVRGLTTDDGWIDELLRPDLGFETFLRAALYTRDFRYRVGRWMREEGLDLYSAMFRDITMPRRSVWFGRFENLRADLLRFLDEVTTVDEALRKRILTSPAEYVGGHRDYRTYYTPELRDLVAERCERIITRFGYRFDPERSPLASPPRGLPAPRTRGG